MSWNCPVCGAPGHAARYTVRAGGTEGGVDAEAFRPSSEQFGRTAGRVVRCTACGHGSLAEPPPPQAMSDAYAEAADEVSLREEDGQVETARRGLAELELYIRPGLLLDVGCWTGSFLVAARDRGWQTAGVEPSAWASQRARDRGLDVRTVELDGHGLRDASCRAVVACDVLEHLVDPGAAVRRMHAVLEAGGVLYVTVPDAGSGLARLMGRRWWSVLPMHVQYFTRSSMRRLLENHGFEVLSMRTHAKVFTSRYYAERLGGYSAGLGRAAVAVAERLHVDGRMVAPDFRDRMAVIARRID